MTQLRLLHHSVQRLQISLGALVLGGYLQSSCTSQARNCGALTGRRTPKPRTMPKSYHSSLSSFCWFWTTRERDPKIIQKSPNQIVLLHAWGWWVSGIETLGCLMTGTVVWPHMMDGSCDHLKVPRHYCFLLKAWEIRGAKKSCTSHRSGNNSKPRQQQQERTESGLLPVEVVAPVRQLFWSRPHARRAWVHTPY